MIPDPDLSVIIPTFNRPAGLARLLGALAGQDYPEKSFEVIVVDDGGATNLSSLLSWYRNSLSLILLRQQNQGPAAARNHGARCAKGSCLIFIDDDCEPSAGWLSSIKKAWAARPAAIGGGYISDGLEGNLYSRAGLLLQEYLMESYNPIDTPGGFFTANNLWVPAQRFLDSGGFDAGMIYAEDRELCYRWSCQGGEFQYVAEAGVIHHKRLNLASFLRMHYHYGQGTAVFRAVAARKRLPRVKISSPGWYLNLLLYGIRQTPGVKGLLLSTLTAASQAAYLAGIAWGELRKAAQGRQG